MDSFAAQVAAMDLIISIDNSTVILSGALGNTVWTLIPLYSTYLQWPLGKNETPWHPTMTLFRQTPESTWEEITSTIRKKLEQLSEKTEHNMDG